MNKTVLENGAGCQAAHTCQAADIKHEIAADIKHEKTQTDKRYKQNEIKLWSVLERPSPASARRTVRSFAFICACALTQGEQHRKSHLKSTSASMS